MLTNAELRRGDVSLGYVSRLMRRKYPDTPLFRKVLQTIWHQVQNAQEIFLVGRINDDDTVTCGTGVAAVAAEYAKILNKPLYVSTRSGTAGTAGAARGDVRNPRPSSASRSSVGRERGS